MEKYYKIVNPKGHYGLIYKEGVNVDPEPFDPRPVCGGGIHFAKEDIFAFLGYGTELWEVTPLSEVVIMDVTPVKYKAHEISMKRIGLLNDCIQFLIEQGADIHANDDDALVYASFDDDLETTKILIEHGANIHTKEDYALRRASGTGRLGMVKLLLEHGSDIHSEEALALKYASGNGRLEVVKYLVEKGANVHAGHDAALREAVKYFRKEVVEYLNSIKQ